MTGKTQMPDCRRCRKLNDLLQNSIEERQQLFAWLEASLKNTMSASEYCSARDAIEAQVKAAAPDCDCSPGWETQCVLKSCNRRASGLPTGFRVLNDGPGREVLLDDRTDDPAPIFKTRTEAAQVAWRQWREIYESEHVT